jgi:hypothetical protein
MYYWKNKWLEKDVHGNKNKASRWLLEFLVGCHARCEDGRTVHFFGNRRKMPIKKIKIENEEGHPFFRTKTKHKTLPDDDGPSPLLRVFHHVYELFV